MTADFPKIFCISLARAADRRRRMIARLENLGVDYEIVNAVDGAACDLSALGDRLQQDVARRHWGRELAKTEIGLYLSHYGLWQRFADEQVDVAIVVEDDADFSADFLSVAGDVVRIPYDWDVVILHTQAKLTKNARTLCAVGGGGYRVIRCAKRIAGTAGYLISAAGARKLLRHCHKINAPVDVAYSEWWRSGIKYYAVSPKVVIEDGSETTIGAYKKKFFNPEMSFGDNVRGHLWRRWQRISIALYNRRHPIPPK